MPKRDKLNIGFFYLRLSLFAAVLIFAAMSSLTAIFADGGKHTSAEDTISYKISAPLKSFIHPAKNDPKLQQLSVKIFFDNHTTLSEAEKILKDNKTFPISGSFGYQRSLEAKVSGEELRRLIKCEKIKSLTVSDAPYIIPTIESLPLDRNAAAAELSRVSEIKPGGISGYNLTGAGCVLGLWESDMARITHIDLAGRIIISDYFLGASSHATHIAGTMIGKGLGNPLAQGMSINAAIQNYSWSNDTAEIASSSQVILASNHSYVVARGWHQDGTGYHWYGDTSISQNEDYMFGKYDSACAEWDALVYASDAIIIEAAGNERVDVAPIAGTPHTHKGEGVYSDTHSDDGKVKGGYDTIPQRSAAKNIITVGAVEKTSSPKKGSAGFAMSTFSSWGPADDGRIKPDIVADGVALLSCHNTGDSDYTLKSGTSMASPVITGSIALFNEMYRNIYQKKINAALAKGLIIHTAIEAGDYPGPDYKFGWGLLDARAAADFISASAMSKNPIIIEGEYFNQTIFFTRKSSGASSIKITLCYTDLPGTANAGGLDDRTPALVNDLDILVKGPNSTYYYPWSLNPEIPSAPATNFAPNHCDNIEQIVIDTPLTGDYEIALSSSSFITSPPQRYFILLSGFSDTESVSVSGINIADAGDNDNYIEKYEQAKISMNLLYKGTTPVSNIVAAVETNQPQGVRIINASSAFSQFTPSGPIAPDHNTISCDAISGNYSASTLSPIIFQLTDSYNLLEPLQLKFHLYSADGGFSDYYYYTIQCGEPKVYSYPGADTPLAIPDNDSNGIESRIIFSDNFPISEIEVFADITHAHIGDLVAEIISPSGKTVTLHNMTGINGTSISRTYSLPNPPDGPGSLADFLGDMSEGAWTLRVSDHFPYNTGQINSWSLTLKTYVSDYVAGVSNRWEKYE